MSAAANLIFTAGEVRRLDRIAIEQFGIPGHALMQRAAEAAFAAIRSRFPQARHWLLCCGAGNNAGDGYVLARLAREAGLGVTVVAVSDPHRLTGDAGTAWQAFRDQGGSVVQLSEALLDGPDLAVDALLGTGLARPLEGIWLHAVELLNEFGQRRPLVALDIPSGLDADSGAVLGAAVRARLTLSFVGLKRGLFIGAGPAHTGELVFADLGIPGAALAQVTPCAQLVGEALVAGLLRPRCATAHKGSFGHVLVVGGNHGMSGAVMLSGAAALRAGAGLVTVATRPEHVTGVTAWCPELMCHGIRDAAALMPLMERASVVALGPGLGSDDWAEAMYHCVLDSPLPKVVDADALNLLARRPVAQQNWVLTPHPGEAGRLLGMAAGEIQRDRCAALAGLAARYGGSVLLKGRCTLVGHDGNLPLVINRGNPGMATAGMGDVLTGIVAGLMAQYPGASTQLVAVIGAFVHGAAGDAAAAGGQRGLLAEDLLGQLRPWLNPGS